jgi:cold shock CspA family protein
MKVGDGPPPGGGFSTTTRILEAPGIIKWFNNSKGYGLSVWESGLDVFVYYSGILGDGISDAARGRPCQL